MIFKYLYFFHLMVKTYDILSSNRIHSLKYLRSTALDYKDIEIRKSKFVTKTQFLCNLLNFKWPSIYRCLCPIYTSTHKSCVRSVLLNPRALTNLTLLDEIKRWVQTREILQPVHRADYSLISPTFPSFVLSPSRPTLLPSPPLQPFPHLSSLPPVLLSFPPHPLWNMC